jgi:hypothetical protein
MAGHLNKQAADGSTSDNLVGMRLFALLGMPIASVGSTECEEGEGDARLIGAAEIDTAPRHRQ